MLPTSTSPVGSPTPQSHQPPQNITRCHVTWHGEPGIQTPSAAGHHCLQPHGLCGGTNIPGSGSHPAPHGAQLSWKVAGSQHSHPETCSHPVCGRSSSAGAGCLDPAGFACHHGWRLHSLWGSCASAWPPSQQKTTFFCLQMEILFGFITKSVPIGSCASGHRRAEPLPSPLLPDSRQLSCGEPSGGWGRRGYSSAFPLQDRLVPSPAQHAARSAASSKR